jgi:hypothetical protein
LVLGLAPRCRQDGRRVDQTGGVLESSVGRDQDGAGAWLLTVTMCELSVGGGPRRRPQRLAPLGRGRKEREEPNVPLVASRSTSLQMCEYGLPEACLPKGC